MIKILLAFVSFGFVFSAFGADSQLDGIWKYTSVECTNGQSVSTGFSPEMVEMTQIYLGNKLIAELKVSNLAPAVEAPSGESIEYAGCQASATVLFEKVTSNQLSGGQVQSFSSTCPQVFTKERTAASLTADVDYKITEEGNRLEISKGPNEKTEAECGAGQAILNIYQRIQL